MHVSVISAERSVFDGRADASYSQTSHDFNVSGNTKIFGAMASFVYALMPASAPARLILNAGVGLYTLRIEAGGWSDLNPRLGLVEALRSRLSSARVPLAWLLLAASRVSARAPAPRRSCRSRWD